MTLIRFLILIILFSQKIRWNQYYLIKHHLISGLPRRGPMLFADIQRQNPRIHAGMTSPVDSLFTVLHNSTGQGNEYSDYIDEKQRARMLCGLFELYYKDHSQDYQEPEFDARLGVQGLHEVKRKVALCPRQNVLPPDLLKQRCQLDFWKNNEGSLAHIINATPSPCA